jgi:hypothetical protein
MNIPLDRLVALCTRAMRRNLACLSKDQVATLRQKIRSAISYACGQPVGWVGRPAKSRHPRASYWREYKRRKAAEKRSRQGRMTA